MNKQSFITILLSWLMWIAGIEVKADVFGYDFFVNDSNGKPIYYNYIGDGSEVEVTDGLFLYSGDLVIPESVYYNNKNYKVTRIGENAFYQDDFIKSIIIPNSVKSIENYAFYKCTSLKSISFGNSLSNIGYSSFERCKSLTTVDLPNTVTIIGERAFNGCSGLMNFTIPNSVTSIGYFAFDGCDNLTSIFSHMLNPVEIIGNTLGSTFSKTTYNNATLFVPEGTIGIYRAASGWRDFINIEEYFPNETNNYSVETGQCFYFNGIYYKIVSNIEKTVEVACKPDIWLEAYTGDVEIPSYVSFNGFDFKVIGLAQAAFDRCSYLTSIKLPNTLTYIGKEAFSMCSELHIITIPESVVQYGYDVFNMTGLEDIIVLNPIPVEVPYNAFVSPQIRNCVLHVPYGSLNLYINADEWNKFSISEMEEEPSIYNKCGYFATWNYLEETRSLTITGSRKMWNYDFENASPWSIYKENIDNLIIEDGIESIGNYNFFNLSKLTNVIIPSSVTEIGDYAFSGCKSLNNVTVPNIFTNIGSHCFQDCQNLTSFSIPTSLSILRDGLFEGCINLMSIDIPISVKDIGYSVFDGCRSLTSVIIPNSVENISNRAFYCENLTKVFSYINDPFEIVSTTDDFNGVFHINTVQNGTLYVPEGTKEKYKALNGWKDFVNIEEISSENKGVCGNDVYWNYSKESKTLTISGTGAMWDYDSPLNSTTLSYTPWESFKSNIVHIIIDEGVSTVGDWAFCKCENVSTVSLPNTLKTIGKYSFDDCKTLKSMVIPDNVISLEEAAFSGCSSLSSISLGDGLESLDRWAFSFCYCLTSITIPKSVKYIDTSAFDHNTLENVSVNDNNPHYDSRDNCNAIIESSSNKLIFGINSSTIPQSVNIIGKDAFEDCEISSIDIPNSVTTLEAAAFGGCKSLNSIVIPNSVTYIGNSAFQNCKSLTSITIPNSVTTLGQYCFYGCSSLASVELSNSIQTIDYCTFKDCSCLSSITIPNSVTSIMDEAFYNCSGLWLSITIPNSVKSIGHKAFYFCSGVQILILGNNITHIGSSAFEGCNLHSVYCYSEKITNAENNDPFYYPNIRYSTLLVPVGSIDYYKSLYPWYYFGAILPLSDNDPQPSGIKEVIHREKIKKIFDLRGYKLDKPQKGINIFNGKKVIIK